MRSRYPNHFTEGTTSSSALVRDCSKAATCPTVSCLSTACGLEILRGASLEAPLVNLLLFLMEASNRTANFSILETVQKVFNISITSEDVWVSEQLVIKHTSKKFNVQKLY